MFVLRAENFRAWGKKQQALPLVYKEIKLDTDYRIELIVENKVIVEAKSVDAFTEIHKAQLITYMKLANINLFCY